MELFRFLIPVLIYLFHWWLPVQSNEFLALFSSSDGDYCLTNSTSAIYCVPNSSTDTEKSVVPGLSYFCDFDDVKNNCISDFSKLLNWQIVSSEVNENMPIFDMRWEGFPTQEVEPRSYSPPKIIENFKITLSLRGEEAHLFFCDKKKVEKGNCYWFVLQGWNRNYTVLRKCERGDITTEENKYRTNDCYDKKRVNVTHPKEYPHYLSSGKWNHIMIEKQESTLFLRHIENNQTVTIFAYQDNFPEFDIKHLVIHTKSETLLYKIHEHKYLRADSVSDTDFGNPISVIKHSYCLSFLLTTCELCYTDIHIVEKNGNERITLHHERINPSYGSWTYHKILLPEISHSITFVYIIINTVSSSQGSLFWSLDNIGGCYDSDYRVLQGKTGSIRECRLVETNAVISKKEIIDYIPKNDCGSLKFIGDSCIPCNFMRDPNRLKPCEKLTICQENRCFCSPGYTGSDCKNDCPKDTFGYNCSNACGNCVNRCNNEDGSCVCDKLFQDRTCNIPKRDQVLKYPPALIKSDSKSCTVQLTNIEFLGQSEPEYYLIQYKIVGPTNEFWENFDRIKYITDRDPVTIGDLKSSTTYAVRILISSEQSKITNLQKSKIPFVLCKTTCNDWNDEDITIQAKERNATITLKLSPDKCVPKNVNWILSQDGTTVKQGSSSTDIITLYELFPHTSYTISFEGQNVTLTFKTEESVPSLVEDLKTEEVETKYIQLSWKMPRHPNGEIEYYLIEFQRLRIRKCTTIILDDRKIQNTTDTNIVLTDLQPFSVYSVDVYAVNRKYQSKPNHKEVETLGLEFLEDDEGLGTSKITSITAHETGASFYRINLDCGKIRGELNISLVVNCTSQWCVEPRKMFPVSLYGTTFNVNGLQAFCNYTYSLSFCRNTGCVNGSNGTFTTKAANPNRIRDVWIVSKGKNFVALRWLPPYPPSGTLSYYKIITECESCTFSTQKYENFIEPKNCDIWPEYHCVNLTHYISYKNIYSIEIQATNREKGVFVLVNSILEVTAKEEASEPPYALKVIWNADNTMNLFWNHPNETNGNLKKFNIVVRTNQKHKEINYLLNKYRLTYAAKINYSWPPAQDLEIQIKAVNSVNGKPAIITESSYPRVPIFVNPAIKVTDYSETTISISIDSKRNDEFVSTTSSYLLILVTDTTTTIKDTNIEILEKLLKTTLEQGTHLRVAAEFVLKYHDTSNLINFTVGDNSDSTKSVLLSTDITNNPLRQGTYYNLTALVINVFKTKYRYILFMEQCLTAGDPRMTSKPPVNEPVDGESSGGLIGSFLLLLVLIVIIVSGILLYKRRVIPKLPAISMDKILEMTGRIPGTLSGVSRDEDIPLETTEVTQAVSKPVMKVKPKLSVRKSTNPPNAADRIYSKVIKIGNFEEYVRISIEEGVLEKQHALFPRGQTQPWEYGSIKANKFKNRYNNLVAYDHTRVHLETIPGQPYSDYINASYIDGYSIPKAYIATQGPKPSTLDDFWRMIWQENVRFIVMLANVYEGGKKKVEQYWPNINEELTFDDMCIKYQSVDLYANFEYRIFHVTRGNETRKLEQLHYTTWPDHGVPLYPQSLVPFVSKILKISLSSSSPIVVHCSAGVGRTGTILLCDISLRMAAKEGSLDLLNVLQKLREQRPNMVDNVQQYKLAHLVVLECLMGLHTSIPCNDQIYETVEKLINEEEYKVQINYLTETEWQDQAMKNMIDFSDEEFVDYPKKNRIPDIIPENQGRIFLTRYPLDDPSSSYINAVQVDAFRCPGRFIVTQQPMPNTIGDFWRLITERQISVIVSLNDVNIKDKTCCRFWPMADEPELEPVDFILVTFVKVVDQDYFNIYFVNAWLKNKQNEKLEVQIVSFKSWPAKSLLPSSCENFLSFWEETESRSRHSDNIIVTCFDGVTASGIYVALSFVIEKMKLEQECDVCLAVRTVRHNRKQFVENESQFIFLYQAAIQYINGFQSYANFQQ